MSAEKNREELPRIQDEQFDRLVDSELSETGRRELLGRLDSEPEGWRRCAMAFLESQCWKESLGSESARRASPDSVATPSRFWRVSAKYVGTAAAMAICFLAALILGLFLDHEGPTNGRHASQWAGTSVHPWQTVTLVGGTRPDGSRRYLRLPAVEQDSVDAAQLQNLPAGIPSGLLNALQQAGHDVRQSRELVPVRLEDGRRLVIPVDQLDVNGVGPAEYQ